MFNHSSRYRSSQSSHRARLALAGLVLTCLLALVVASPVFAQDIPRLTSQVTDQTRNQVLASGRSQIDGALQDLLNRENIQLFVLFVDSTGGRTVTDFADQVARQNSLGGNDALLVVALADRTDSLWRSSSLQQGLTDRELQDVLTRQVEPRLAQGDFPGAVVGAARGLQGVTGEGDSGTGGGGPSLPLIIGILLLAVGGWWLWSRMAQNRRERQVAAQRELELGKLAQEANALLIQADEALRAGQEEVGFAEAQFTEDDVAPYRQALADASTELKAAFALRQQLDDEIPEDAETRRGMLEELIQRAGHAQELLEEQRKRIAELRDLERNAPQILAALPAQLDTLEQRIPQAQQTLADLDRYAESSWSAVKGHVPEAEKRLTHARSEVEAGQGALSAGQSAAAARSARVAQQALVEATHLLEAIETQAKSIRQAEAAVGPQLATAQTDITTARSTLATHAGSAAAGRLAESEQALAQAQHELSAAQPDYPAALRLATQAETIADEIVASVRQEEEQRAREAQLLVTQLQVAEASYRRAADFIAARHGGIGREARTRLAEAERHLERAQSLADTDRKAALDEARMAERLAEEAYRIADQDFDSHDRYGPRGGSVILPIPIPMGGGWGGGGWGGTPWGSGGGGGGSVGGGSVGGHW